MAPEININAELLGLSPGRVCLADQITAVKREVVMRRQVYARAVQAGRMKPEAARRELEAMEAVLGTLLAVRNLSEAVPAAVPILMSLFSTLAAFDELRADPPAAGSQTAPAEP